MIEEKREVGSFDKITVGGNFQVLVKKSDNPGLQVIADENLQEFITVEMHGQELIVNQDMKLISTHKIELIISYTEISEIRIMGAAKIMNEGTLEARSFTIRMDGAGMVDLNLDTEFLEVALSGAGLVNVSGHTVNQEIRLTGAGSLEAYDLVSENCDIVVSGIGKAKIFATGKLEAKLEGVGGIDYAGEPEEIITNVSGLGKISRATDF